MVKQELIAGGMYWRVRFENDPLLYYVHKDHWNLFTDALNNGETMKMVAICTAVIDTVNDRVLKLRTASLQSLVESSLSAYG